MRARTISTVPHRHRARCAAATRDLGAPYRLVVLFRAPPPLKMVLVRPQQFELRIDPAARPREVMVAAATGAVVKVRRKHGWVAYYDDKHSPNLWTSGPLDPRDEHIVWSWGWESEAAKALAVTWALG